VQEEGLWAAGNLSAGSDKLKDKFVELGVGNAIGGTLKANGLNPHVVKVRRKGGKRAVCCVCDVCVGSSATIRFDVGLSEPSMLFTNPLLEPPPPARFTIESPTC
jgi:hypothetical protein